LAECRGRGGGKPLKDATKYVASRGRPQLDWGPAQLLDGDVADAIARMKRDDGPELQVHGSADLPQTLLNRGLVDEFRIWTFPLVIGTGKRLFGDGTVPTSLRLRSGEVSTTGVFLGWYEPAGEIDVGSFKADEPPG
jgi:dihydrofolate reductase